MVLDGVRTMSLLAIFAASMLYVGLKAFQQLNVTLHKPLWVLPTSFGLATVEIALVVQYAQQGIDAALIAAVGSGSGLGCLVSMWLHGRLRR